MRYLFTILLLALPLRAVAATGDILAVGLDTNGWAIVHVSGFSSNSVFNNGFINKTNYTGTNETWIQIPSTTNGLMLTYTDWGWSEAGVRVNVTLTNWGTEMVRMPDPSETLPDLIVDSGVTRMRVALYREMPTTASNILAYVSTNGFKDGSTFCAGVSGASVTNGTLLQPWTPTVKIINDGWEYVTTANHTQLVSALSPEGIASVWFINTDSAGLVITNKQTRRRICPTYFTAGEVRGPKYWDTIPFSSLANGEVRQDVRVHPRVGNVWDTRDNLFTGHTPDPTSFTNFNAQGGSLKIAVVATNAVGPGVATNTTPANVHPDHYFTNYASAAFASAASNSYTAAKVYGRTGANDFSGQTVTFAQEVLSWVDFDEYPGEDFMLQTRSAGTQNLGGRMRFLNCKFNFDTGITPINNCRRVLIRDSIVATPGTPVRASGSSQCVIRIVNSHIQKYGSGLQPFSGDPLAFDLIGVNLNGFTNTAMPFLMVDAWHTNAASTNLTFITHKTGAFGNPTNGYYLWENCHLAAVYGDATSVGTLGSASYNLTNMMFANIYLQAIKSTTGPTPKSVSLFHSDVITDRCALINWEQEGMRAQSIYVNSANVFKRVVYKNCIFDVLGWVSDDETGTTGMTGNWLSQYGTGFAGNAVPNTTFTGSAIHDNAEYLHLWNYWRPDTANRKGPGWLGLRDDQAYRGDTDPSTGNGDPRKRSDSAVFFVRYGTEPLMDYDLQNVPRAWVGGFDPPGAFASGNARKGDFF